MNIKLGDLNPQQFAERVGTRFTDTELQQLASMRSGKAILTGPEDFHIFDDPAISIHIGSAESAAIGIFKAANERAPFNCAVSFYLDEDWRTK